jgi:hypothetical protein
MAYGQVDPATLEGDALMRWYRRTPQNIADERRRAAADAYNRFFFPTRSDQSLGSDPATQDDQDSSADGVQASTSQDNGQANAWPGFGAALSVAPTMVRPSTFASALGPGLLDDWTGGSSADSGAQNGSVASTRGLTDQDDGQSGSGPDDGDDSPTASTVDKPVQVAAAFGRGLLDYWSGLECSSCHGYTPNPFPPDGGRSPFPPNVTPRSGSSGGGGPQRKEKYPQCEMQERNDRGICAQQPTPKAQAVCVESAVRRRIWCDNNGGEIGTPSLFTARYKSGRRWP